METERDCDGKIEYLFDTNFISAKVHVNKW